MTTLIAGRPAPGVSLPAQVRLRTGQYRKFAAIKGLITVAQHANALAVPDTYLTDVITGAQAPSESFIANCLNAFPELDFADLFEVIDDTEQVPA